LRKPVAILILSLVAALGAFVPTAAATVVQPKVVIIVGATHSATATYRTYADQAYAEARKYTSNVIKVYSPNATWSKVKSATVGANVVIYMGHGNGWPSPYTYDPLFTTKDGFGLNATAGAGDYNNKYYGEPYVATLDLAPNAIILLHHLCYASGNSEPGAAQPSVSVAHQRLDNYGAGFLKGRAAAVIADGHRGPVDYLRALFTTHQTIEQLWRTQPNANGHVVTFKSARTPGATAFSDPDTTTSGFYRSLVGDRTVTTDDILGDAYSDTSLDPASLMVPGNATVTADGAGLYGDPTALSAGSSGAPDTTLAAGTRLRVLGSTDTVAADGSRVVHVGGIDDAAIDGYMATSGLTPRDSTAPFVRSLQTDGAFSPNGDGTEDIATISGRLSESAAWTVRVRDSAHTVRYSASGSGNTFSAQWDGKAAGATLPDGTYDVSVTAIDGWANGPGTANTPLVLDTVPAQLTALDPEPDVVRWFAPNGDGSRETVALTATSSESGSLSVRIRNAAGTQVRAFSVATGTGPVALSWDGKNATGAVVPDGDYIVRLTPVDAVGNAGSWAERTVRVVAALRSVKSSAKIFYPQDLDSMSRTTSLSFTLARPMTVAWTLRNAAGDVVITRYNELARPAGTSSWTFDGRGPDGTMVPPGRYTSYVYATDGTLAASQAVSFDADAFAQRLSDATPTRGQSVTIYATSAEPLSTMPRAYVYEPGLSTWAVAMTKTGTYTYRVTLTLKKGGTSGTVKIKISAIDSKGQVQRTTRAYPLG
jgi:flagellar hook assembly protein FlgD